MWTGSTKGQAYGAGDKAKYAKGRALDLHKGKVAAWVRYEVTTGISEPEIPLRALRVLHPIDLSPQSKHTVYHMCPDLLGITIF